MIRLVQHSLFSVLLFCSAAGGQAVDSARRLADVEHRYDEAERTYLQLLDRNKNAVVAAELAAMYERLGEIGAAVDWEELAVAVGGFDDATAQRLESQLGHCKRQRASLVRFPVSLEARSEIRQVTSSLKTRQWAAAFNLLAGVLDRFEGTFLQQGTNQYLGLWQWARSALAELPDPAREVFAKWADAHWQEAMEDGSVAAIRAFAVAHPQPQALHRALLTWSDTLADQGEMVLAHGLINRSEVDGRAGDQRRQLWSRYFEAGSTSSKSPMDGSELVQRWGRGWSVAKPVGTDSVGLAADDERIYTYDQSVVNAYDRRRGTWRWRYAPTAPVDRVDVRREVYGRRKGARAKWIGATDPPAILRCPAGVIVVERYHRGEPESAYSVATCLHPETGAVQWRLDRNPVLAKLRVCSDPVYSGGKVLIVAATRRDYPEYWLCAVNGLDGRLLWRRPIAVGATPTRCTGRGLLHAGQSGPTLIVDGEVVYYATHMGALVAVDRDVGQPLWAVAYPRVARFGPIVNAPLPLLHRRTEPMQLTDRYLVLLPRDVNAILVIDRSTGALVHTIRSLDLLELIDADDEHLIVTTFSGEIRCYRVDTGKLAWSWRVPQGEAMRRPRVVGRDVIVCHGARLTRINHATGQAVDRRDVAAPGELRMLKPVDQPVVVSDRMVRAIEDARGESIQPAPEIMVAQARGERETASWHHEAYVPGRYITARLLAPADDPILIVSDRAGLYALSPNRDYEQLWWRPLDPQTGLWAASVNTTSAEVSRVSLTLDRQSLQILDACTGALLTDSTIDARQPIRDLYVVGESVWQVGTSTIACQRIPDPETVWTKDVSPCVFEKIVPGDPVTCAYVQPGGGEPGRLLRIDTDSGRVEQSYVLAAPLPIWLPFDESDKPDRYPVPRLSYAQDELQKDDDGYFVGVAGATVRLNPGPLRVVDVCNPYTIVEITDYWGLVDPLSGDVVLMAPSEVDSSFPPLDVREQVLAAWLNDHPVRDRNVPPTFHFENEALVYSEAFCFRGMPLERQWCGWLTDLAGRRLGLAGLQPRRTESLGDRIMVEGTGGVVVLRGPLVADRKQRSPLGKEPADMFEPVSVDIIAGEGLVLDGDLSDWPTDGWHVLRSDRHAWPIQARRIGHDTSVEARFRWAIDDDAVWLAVRVDDDVLVDSRRSLTSGGDSVDVMLTSAAPNIRHRIARPGLEGPITIELAWVDRMPIALLRSPGVTVSLGKTVADRLLFDRWRERCYGATQRLAEEVVVAAERVAQQTCYEVRIQRSLLDDGRLAGFDIRVADDDGEGVESRLEWCGALYDSATFEAASFRVSH